MNLTDKEMQLELFAEEENNERDLFGDISEESEQPRVYIGGTIGRYSQREARLLASQKGIDTAAAPSKFVCMCLLGEGIKDDHLEIIEKLAFNGFYIPTYRGEEAIRMLEADRAEWPEMTPVKKHIVIDMSHYERMHIDMDERENPIYGREIFFGKGWRGDFMLLNQMAGFLGSCGDFDHIWPETDLIALSDSTIEHLERGEQDETTRYIAEHYNQSDAITFAYKFISESDILSVCETWACKYDSVEMAHFLNRYRHSMSCGCFVALDFETVSGLQIGEKTYLHLPLSVGMFKVKDCKEDGRYKALMHPPVGDKVKYDCYVDRSLNQDTLRDAPAYGEVYARMQEFCADADYLVCHNHTEVYVLKELSELCGNEIDKPMRDTLKIMKQHGETDNSLTAACLRHGIVRTGGEHDAMSDAEACAALYLQLLKAGIVEEVSQQKSEEKKKPHGKSAFEDVSAYTKQIDASERIQGSLFEGVVVVITGMAYEERDKLYQYMYRRGAIVKKDVSGKADWLVLGPNGGESTRKLNRAKELGIRIMQLDELLQLIEQDQSGLTAAP